MVNDINGAHLAEVVIVRGLHRRRHGTRVAAALGFARVREMIFAADINWR